MKPLPLNEIELDSTCKRRLTDLQQKIKAIKVDGTTVARAFQKLKLNWNYHSNAIEGNRLTYGETVALLMHGVTAKGKSLKDHLDVKGHNEAISYMMELIDRKRSLSHNDIRELHKLILSEPYYVDTIKADGQPGRRMISIGQYKTMPNHVKTKTGEVHFYVEPARVHEEMTLLLDWLHDKDNSLSPVVKAAIFHHRFVAIHPFDDGNGRLGRILMNFILIGNGYPPAIISTNDRENYYSQLSQADTGSYNGILEYICESVTASIELQLAVYEGREVDDLDDIDKEIALFKAGLSPVEKGEISVSLEEKEKIALHFILPIAKKIDARFEQIKELFNQANQAYSFSNPLLNGNVTSKSLTEFEESINKAIELKRLNFLSFKLSYSLDTYHLSSTKSKYSIELHFALDQYLFLMKSSGIPNAHALDFASDYSSRSYYQEVDKIARVVIEAFFDFTKRAVKS